MLRPRTSTATFVGGEACWGPFGGGAAVVGEVGKVREADGRRFSVAELKFICLA